jgi:hypothetical protein
MSPWLIVTTGWPAVTAGHALAAAGTRPTVLAAGALVVGALILVSVGLLRRRSRTGAGPRSTS